MWSGNGRYCSAALSWNYLYFGFHIARFIGGRTFSNFQQVEDGSGIELYFAIYILSTAIFDRWSLLSVRTLPSFDEAAFCAGNLGCLMMASAISKIIPGTSKAFRTIRANNDMTAAEKRLLAPLYSAMMVQSISLVIASSKRSGMPLVASFMRIRSLVGVATGPCSNIPDFSSKIAVTATASILSSRSSSMFVCDVSVSSVRCSSWTDGWLSVLLWRLSWQRHFGSPTPETVPARGVLVASRLDIGRSWLGQLLKSWGSCVSPMEERADCWNLLFDRKVLEAEEPVKAMSVFVDYSLITKKLCSRTIEQ